MPGDQHNEAKQDGDAGPILVNRARRAVIRSGQLGACIITGTDKIRSGFGNGDCLMLDFRHQVFAVSDATERFPSASSSLLSRLAERLAKNGAPRSEADWRDLARRVYAPQRFHGRATFSCVGMAKDQDPTTAWVVHGGDSLVQLIDLAEGRAGYATSPDMCFAGRTKDLMCVDEIPIRKQGSALIMASDGIRDAARLTGRTLEQLSGSVLSRFPLHEIPEGLTDYLAGLPAQAEYDDIGLIVFSPTEVEAAEHPVILIGGTTPVEEARYREGISEGVVYDGWVELDEVTDSLVRI